MNEEFKNWYSKYISNTLPDFYAIPDFGLYMDQVIMLMDDYLCFDKADGEHLLTPAMINNYVKMDIMPSPIKKKYQREHIVYLIMISVMKPVISIAEIDMIFKSKIKGDIESFYNIFCSVYSKIYQNYDPYISEMLKIMGGEQTADGLDLSIIFAIISRLGKLSAKKLINKELDINSNKKEKSPDKKEKDNKKNTDKKESKREHLYGLYS